MEIKKKKRDLRLVLLETFKAPSFPIVKLQKLQMFFEMFKSVLLTKIMDN